MSVDQNLIDTWIDADPDPNTRRELLEADPHDLADRFSGPLVFGTAGLRGPVRAGPNGMNTAVVIRTTAGIAQWLHGRCLGGSTVIVGRDTRHGSETFATAAAEVLAAAGFRVVQLPDPTPTPVVAFACRKLKAAVAIQITASHNPATDNGYKVYLDGGAQIISPADRDIEAAIAAVGPANSVPRAAVEASGAHLVDEYIARVATLPRGTDRGLRIAFTPMHGVGGATALAAFRAAGFTDIHVVDEQFDPNPDFPTVEFPNPEEPGATDLLLATADRVDADIAIALDPDADRCAVGVKGPNGWFMLCGDDTGAVLGDYILSHTSGDRLAATTIVSSSMLKSIAASHNSRYSETLTGFKWLARAGDGLVFAYEEALGLCVDPAAVRDKDGISAAVVACDYAANLKSAGRTFLDVLDDLAAQHGVHLTAQVSRRFNNLAHIAASMTTLRNNLPKELGGAPVVVEDLNELRGPKRTDAIILRTDQLRVVVRPSGTEPKLKCYLEAVAPTAAGDLSAARQQAERLLDVGRAFAHTL
ncbi:phospho-sugar mutase [Hoyosella rhizosphaerae]|uniref:Phosphomannomutase PmmB n=1 Tax=Hoyosella rhizosphaerae TaxID=1755582 RepID=A0A916UBM4_9ACTN|nr:phospho-sugar mutase [Hoyosella rhizosphaerae]MBN4926059.1 phospho-sugar mutase [Hoyosella rhizosphaerae]GGC65876.1 putative phosphomannomutase PmmB [Hoyosella rhizosphaerae]